MGSLSHLQVPHRRRRGLGAECQRGPGQSRRPLRRLGRRVRVRVRAALRRTRAEGCSDHATIPLGRASHVRRVAVAPSTSPHRNSTANWLTSASRTACCSALSEGMLRAIVQSLLQPSEPHAPQAAVGPIPHRWHSHGAMGRSGKVERSATTADTTGPLCLRSSGRKRTATRALPARPTAFEGGLA
jgi:hypothetical protein